MIIDRREYIQSKANGTLKQLRGDKISLLVHAKYTFGDETRIAYNMIKDPSNPKYIREFEEHEAYAEACKARVDAAFSECERRYGYEIQNT